MTNPSGTVATTKLREFSRILTLRLTLYGLFFAFVSGCNPAFHRKLADRGAMLAISQKSHDPRWDMADFRLRPDARSRFYDPYCPDHPPMPPDDPAAAALAPQPQKPSRKLRHEVEGVGYMELIRTVDRASPASVDQEDSEGTGELQADPLLPPNTPSGILALSNLVELGYVNSREYQERKEGLYLAALDVTLEQSAFAPQFILTQEAAIEDLGRELAGGGSAKTRVLLDPGDETGTIVEPGQSRGSEALDGQVVDRFVGHGPSPATGVALGRLFGTGAALLLRFANETVWDLSGSAKGSASASSLSLEFIQPLLRGGGRAVTLEPLTQAERNLLYEIRFYARFQREFLVSIVTGASIGQADRLEDAFLSDRDSDGRRRRVGYLPLVEQLQVLRNEEENLRLLEDYEKRFTAFHRAGEVSLIQLDRVRQDVANARSRVLRARKRYFGNLDRFKIQLGLPTDLPLIIDEGMLAYFELEPDNCELPNLPGMLDEVPYDRDEALTIALENRLDLQNARAQLVDHWRKVDVAANQLMGVLDLQYEGEWLTPDPLRTSQPLNLAGERGRHTVRLNTELPLVRVDERNQYRATLIEYQVARRRLMETEDLVRLEVQDTLRELQRARADFEIQRRAVILACRRVDQSRRMLALPPTLGESRELGANAARDLLDAQEDLVDAQNDLVESWIDYQTATLELRRDLEILNVSDLYAIDLTPSTEQSPHVNERRGKSDGDEAGRISYIESRMDN